MQRSKWWVWEERGRNNPGNRTGKEAGERKIDVGRQVYIGFFLSD